MKIFGHPPDKSLLLNEPINIRDINSIDAYVCFGINSLKLLSAFPAIKEKTEGSKIIIVVPTASKAYLKK